MNYSIWIPQDAIDFILKNGKEWSPMETGGVLIGYRASEEVFVITKVIGTGNKAIHKRYSFEPDQNFHELEISRLYFESGQIETYLGDWHTHPKSYPYLSSRDKETFRTIALHKESRLINPIMLIMSSPSPEFKIWVLNQSKKKHRDSYVECGIIIY